MTTAAGPGISAMQYTNHLANDYYPLQNGGGEVNKI